MSHEVESIAWANEVPWHGLGVKVSDDLTPAQMLEAASLDWTVEKVQAFVEIDGKKVDTGRSALVRSSDNSILDIISDDWVPNQNIDAFNFFNDFIAAGDMKMEVAGSLKNGRIVWALAKLSESFDILGGKDKVDAYLNFTNPHQYGKSIDVRLTPIRVVCNNTLTLALNQKAKNVVKVSHRNEFDGDAVKEALGIASEKLARYKEMAEHLSTRRAKDEDIVSYFKRIFPVSESSEKEMSRNAELIVNNILHNQPGAELGEGTWWQAYNAVTYTVDHVLGRNADNRLHSAWYGGGQRKKVEALHLALEMADA